MWTSKNRARYDRSKLRYPSDLTDDEWGLVEPLIPPGKTGGGKRTVIMREVVNGLMYILSTGCQWRAIPKDLSLSETLCGWRLTENRAMLLFNEGSFRAHWLDGRRSISVAGGARGRDLDIAAANKCFAADCS
jgi:transposase